MVLASTFRLRMHGKIIFFQSKFYLQFLSNIKYEKTDLGLGRERQRRRENGIARDGVAFTPFSRRSLSKCTQYLYFLFHSLYVNRLFETRASFLVPTGLQNTEDDVNLVTVIGVSIAAVLAAVVVFAAFTYSFIQRYTITK
jgi:hypothetical protein